MNIGIGNNIPAYLITVTAPFKHNDKIYQLEGIVTVFIHEDVC